MFRLHGARQQILMTALVLLAGAPPMPASELDEALAISRNIQTLHMPYGTILDPVFASADPGSPGHTEIVSYTRAGDSAIWTGHYLAAEAFRYQVTRSADALDNVWRALLGIRSLLDVTGTDVLARCLALADSPYATSIQQEEAGHGIYYNSLGDQNYFWIGNTSRDQYSGVMFGLSVAYDLVDDRPDVRDFIRHDVTRILNYLLRHGWNVVMPDGRTSTTFLHRPDQQLSFLQIGRRTNPARFAWIYALYRSVYASSVILPIRDGSNRLSPSVLDGAVLRCAGISSGQHRSPAFSEDIVQLPRRRSRSFAQNVCETLALRIVWLRAFDPRGFGVYRH